MFYYKREHRGRSGLVKEQMFQSSNSTIEHFFTDVRSNMTAKLQCINQFLGIIILIINCFFFFFVKQKRIFLFNNVLFIHRQHLSFLFFSALPSLYRLPVTTITIFMFSIRF